MTFDTRGHTMMGVSPEQAVLALAELGADAIGGNCGNGPDEIVPVIQRMHAAAPDVTLVAKSNVGMPVLVDTRAVYLTDAPTMANWAVQMHEAGARIVGGCCGSTPEHLAAMHDALIPAAAKLTHTMGERPLKVGVQLPEVEREVRWPELLAMARARGRRLRLDLARRPPALPLARSAAARAVGGLVDRWPRSPPSTRASSSGRSSPAPSFHNPAMLAKQAATIDEISGGRLILGLGAGWNETEFRAFGFPFDHRVDRFEEAFTIIRTLLQDGRDRLRRPLLPGARLRAAAARAAPGGPPLMVGSNGPRMLRITAAPRPIVEQLVRRHRQPPGRRAGRCATSSTRRVATWAAIPARSSGRSRSWSGCPGGTGRSRATTPTPRPTPLEGTPDEMADVLRALRTRGGRPRPAGDGPDHACVDRGVRTGARPPRRLRSDPSLGTNVRVDGGVHPTHNPRAMAEQINVPPARIVLPGAIKPVAIVLGVIVVIAVGVFMVTRGGPQASATASAAPAPIVTPNPHLPSTATAQQVFNGLGHAGLKVTAHTASAGTDDTIVTKIFATYLGWPLDVTQFSSAQALTEAETWTSGTPPEKGDPPVTIAGGNILINLGADQRGPRARTAR